MGGSGIRKQRRALLDTDWEVLDTALCSTTVGEFYWIRIERNFCELLKLERLALAVHDRVMVAWTRGENGQRWVENMRWWDCNGIYVG
jgi:hypothetical protein